MAAPRGPSGGSTGGVGEVEQRLVHCQDAITQISEMLKMEPSPDLDPMLDMLLKEAKTEVDALQSLGEACVAEDRFDLVERISTMAGELEEFQMRKRQWSAGGGGGDAARGTVTRGINDDERMAQELAAQFAAEEGTGGAGGAGSVGIAGGANSVGSVGVAGCGSGAGAPSPDSEARERKKKEKKEKKKEKKGKRRADEDEPGAGATSAEDVFGLDTNPAASMDQLAWGAEPKASLGDRQGSEPETHFGAWSSPPPPSAGDFGEAVGGADGGFGGGCSFGGGFGAFPGGAGEASDDAAALGSKADDRTFRGDALDFTTSAGSGGRSDNSPAWASAAPAGGGFTAWPPASLAEAPAPTAFDGAGSGGGWGFAGSSPSSRSQQWQPSMASHREVSGAGSQKATMRIRMPFQEVSHNVDGFKDHLAQSLALAVGVAPGRIRVTAVRPGP